MGLGHQTLGGCKYADHLARPHQLLSQTDLQQAGHKDRYIHVAGDVLLEVGEIAAFGGDGATAHFLEVAGGLLNGRQAGRFIRFVHQGLNIHPDRDFVLDWKRKGAGITYIPGKTGVYIVENDNPQTHAVTAVSLARFDMVDAHVAV